MTGATELVVHEALEKTRAPVDWLISAASSC